MAADAEWVDCARLAEDAAVIERVYQIGDLPRLKDLLADGSGTLHARIAFASLASGVPGAEVAIEATPQLVCQRCMQGFELHVESGSHIEFAASEGGGAGGPEAGGEREYFGMNKGRISLRELAEEELLLALPLSPACGSPAMCGNAPAADTCEARRPFAGLQDLVKKT